METNEAERRRWNDEYFASVWPANERITDAVTPLLLDALALRDGERVLDVGCGGGRSSIAAARAVGDGGAVVGADVSEPLTRLARDRAAAGGVENVEFQVVDMQTDQVAGGPFGVAMSQFGVMFFDEPVTAFANIRAHLQPGARLAFACWQPVEDNPWFLGSAVAAFVPRPPKPAPGKSPTGPFALADPERTASILEQAGFVEVVRAAHALDMDVTEVTVFDDERLAFMGVPDDELAAARAAVDAQMQRLQVEPGLWRFPLRLQIFEAGVR